VKKVESLAQVFNKRKTQHFYDKVWEDILMELFQATQSEIDKIVCKRFENN